MGLALNSTKFLSKESPTLIQVLRVDGSKSRRIGGIRFFRCPACCDCYDLLSPDDEGMVRCFACNAIRPQAEFEIIRKRRIVAKCAHCGDEVPFIPSTTGLIGPLCSKLECSNYLAVAYANTFLEPKLVLDPVWNHGLRARAQSISGSLCMAGCRSKRDHTVLRVLQVLAMQDDHRFKFGDLEELCSALCFDAKRKKYVGFLIWSENKTAILRQLFVVKSERRKGQASKMVTFWVQHYAKPMGDKFGIEGPNEAAMKLHAKLGHIRIEGSQAIGIKCFFAPTF
jgi:hypothetical protein